MDSAILPADPRQRRVVATGSDTESDTEPGAKRNRARVAIHGAVGQSRAERLGQSLAEPFRHFRAERLGRPCAEPFRQSGAVLELSRSPVWPITG